jgi:hypothetical protein
MEAALLLFSAACFFVGAVCLLVASRRQARDARPLRVVLGEVKPRGWIKDPAVTSLEVAVLLVLGGLVLWAYWPESW